METQTLVKEICPTSTQRWISEGALIVDVREADEVAQLSLNVPEIIHIPLSEFENRYQEIPKDRKVILVCRSGERSLRAAGFLVNHGYDQVVNMQFGIIRWVQKDFPTIGDTSSVLAKESDCCSKPGCC
ncbi:MAG: rhodanese-like domain-containing protein [Saprospiraceae bacterium]|nr:rhodanese-like domain-containing protein [Saprospiraceae bacterium]